MHQLIMNLSMTRLLMMSVSWFLPQGWWKRAREDLEGTPWRDRAIGHKAWTMRLEPWTIDSMKEESFHRCVWLFSKSRSCCVHDCLPFFSSYDVFCCYQQVRQIMEIEPTRTRRNIEIRHIRNASSSSIRNSNVQMTPWKQKDARQRDLRASSRKPSSGGVTPKLDKWP